MLQLFGKIFWKAKTRCVKAEHTKEFPEIQRLEIGGRHVPHQDSTLPPLGFKYVLFQHTTIQIAGLAT